MTSVWRYVRLTACALAGWLAWLIGLYMVEYFKPYYGQKVKR